MGKPCVQCGQPTREGARVCTECGTPIAAQEPAVDAQLDLARQPAAAKTMLGFSSPFAPAPPSQQPQAPAPIATAPMAQTMLGFAAPAELRPAQPPTAQQATAPAPQAAMKPAIAKTMLGVAMPGIAPLQASASPPQSKMGLASGTMLGVAMPGIAPLHAQPVPPQAPAPVVHHEPLPPIVPAPAPLYREAAPAAPVVSTRKGFPLGIVAAVVGFVVLAAGGALLLLSRSAPPMTATAKVSAEGKEQLHLRCETCADGTTAACNGVKATFKDKEVDLDLPTPLTIGDNRFQIAIDRPGVGRDETVKLVLPLAYRIRADVSDIAATPPLVKVQVEVEHGASASVDGKPVTLDANGKATLSYEVTEETSGLTDEMHTLERKIPYEVEEKEHKKSTGEVVIRIGVLPLHLDAPGATLVTEDSLVWVAGRTSKGAEVTANGTSILVAADGTFEGKVDVAPGPQTIALRAVPAHDASVKVAPRTAKVDVNRVASVDAEAHAVDKTPTLGFDELARDATAALGKPIVVVGAVVDTRVAHHHSVMLIDDKRGCAKGPCLVRVDLGAETPLHAGDNVIASGVVGKALPTPDGKTLPQVDASLMGKAGHR